MTEKRITELEERLAYQEDMIESLNSLVSDQNLELMQIKKELIQMKDWLKSHQSVQINKVSDEPPPPHY